MKTKLPLWIVALLALGLLFGGAVHSAGHHHAEEPHHEVEEGEDCQFCSLTPVLLVGETPTVHAAVLREQAAPPVRERVVVVERPHQAAPRAPPV